MNKILSGSDTAALWAVVSILTKAIRERGENADEVTNILVSFYKPVMREINSRMKIDYIGNVVTDDKKDIKNNDIRREIDRRKLKHKQVAAACGVSSYTFSHWLQQELKPERKEKILKAIESIE